MLAAVLGNLLIDLREDRGLERAVRQSIDERQGVRQQLADCQVRRNRTVVAGAKRRAECHHARRDDRRTDKARSEFLELAHADPPRSCLWNRAAGYVPKGLVPATAGSKFSVPARSCI